MFATTLATDRPSQAAQCLATEAAGIAAKQRELPFEAFGQIWPEPGMSLEFEGMGGFMQRDPGPERPDRHAQGSGGRPDVLLDEQEAARRRLHRQRGEVVLAEDGGAHESEEEADLATRHPAIGEGHRRLGQPTADGDHLIEQVRFELADERRERSDIGPDPACTIDDGGAFDDAGQGRPESTRQGRDDARHRLGVERFDRQ